MSTPDPVGSQTQYQYERILAMLQELRSTSQTGRLFDVLEVIRDGMSDLRHEHESIRDEIRNLANLIMQQSQTAD